MDERCQHMATDGEDGEPITYRAQVGPGFTAEDKAALDEVVRAAVRHMRAQPRCPDCGHRTEAHLDDGRCRIRVRKDGHGRRCDCATPLPAATTKGETA